MLKTVVAVCVFMYVARKRHLVWMSGGGGGMNIGTRLTGVPPHMDGGSPATGKEGHGEGRSSPREG